MYIGRVKLFPNKEFEITTALSTSEIGDRLRSILLENKIGIGHSIGNLYWNKSKEYICKELSGNTFTIEVDRFPHLRRVGVLNISHHLKDEFNPIGIGTIIPDKKTGGTKLSIKIAFPFIQKSIISIAVLVVAFLGVNRLMTFEGTATMLFVLALFLIPSILVLILIYMFLDEQIDTMCDFFNFFFEDK